MAAHTAAVAHVAVVADAAAERCTGLVAKGTAARWAAEHMDVLVASSSHCSGDRPHRTADTARVLECGEASCFENRLPWDGNVGSFGHAA